MNKIKREKGRNFTEKEKYQFLEILGKYKEIIDNKKTDSISVEIKNKAWERIAIEFNSMQESGIRNPQQLRHLLDNIRHKAKKVKCGERTELYKTRPETISNRGDYLAHANELLEVAMEDLNSMESIENIKHEEIEIGPVELNASDVQDSLPVPSTRFEKNKKLKEEKRVVKLDILKIRREKELLELDILHLQKKEKELDLRRKEIELKLLLQRNCINDEEL